MAAFGFGAEVGRDEDAYSWALATTDFVADPGSWAATAVVGQRAATLAPGQLQAARVTDPGGYQAKTDAATVALPFTGAMTHQGKLICRELVWSGNGSETDPLDGSTQFVVLDAGDFSSFQATMPDWRTRVSTNATTGYVRHPGERYLVPLHYAMVAQGSTEVRLWDLRNISPMDSAGVRDGVYRDWRPTFTGLGTGAAVERGRWCRIGDTIHASFRLRVAALGLQGTLVFTLPHAAAADDQSQMMPIGTAAMSDNSSNPESLSRTAGTVVLDTNFDAFVIVDRRGAGDGAATVNANTPWVWAAGDMLSVQISYEARR